MKKAPVAPNCGPLLTQGKPVHVLKLFCSRSWRPTQYQQTESPVFSSKSFGKCHIVAFRNLMKCIGNSFFSFLKFFNVVVFELCNKVLLLVTRSFMAVPNAVQRAFLLLWWVEKDWNFSLVIWSFTLCCGQIVSTIILRHYICLNFFFVILRGMCLTGHSFFSDNFDEGLQIFLQRLFKFNAFCHIFAHPSRSSAHWHASELVFSDR